MAIGERQLSTGDERRVQVIRAAIQAFAESGYYGTSTTTVAGRAGISQAYLYRLYPNKEALFVAVLRDVKTQMRELIRVAAENGGPSGSTREAMKAAGANILQDRHLAMVLLHANAVATEPSIREAVIECYRDQVEFLRETFGASDEDIQWFIAAGQLANNVQALQVDPGQEDWARVLLG